MIVGNRNMHQTIALEGTGALVRLLAVSEDEELVRQVLTIISAVATTAADDEREMMMLDGPVGAPAAHRAARRRPTRGCPQRPRAPWRRTSSTAPRRAIWRRRRLGCWRRAVNAPCPARFAPPHPPPQRPC